MLCDQASASEFRRRSTTELYYITGGPARHQQVKPKTWRILRHCHDYWSLDSWQLPLSQPRAEIFFGITFRGRLGNRDFYSGYIFGFVGTLDVNLGYSGTHIKSISTISYH